MKTWGFGIVVSALALCAAPGTAQEHGGFVGTATAYASDIFDRQQTVTGKIARALRARQQGELAPRGLSLGGRFLGSVVSERTNTAGKFPILSRFPPSHTGGTSDTYGVVNEASLNATLTLPSVTAFAQAEYTELAFPGQKATQLRKFWVALGDLDHLPFYLAAGRKTVNFGRFDSYAPFTHSHGTHYFQAQADDPLIELGYVTDRTELAFSLIPAHRGFRVLSSPDNDGDWANFAVNALHRFDLPGQGGRLALGAGFLRGTIYDSAVAHHPPQTGTNRSWSGAWTANATYTHGAFAIGAEYTETVKDWPATGHKVSAAVVQARYRSSLAGRPATWSILASRGAQGADGTEWERMEQIILGLEVETSAHLRLGAEYVYSTGFVPLILPQITADRGVVSHTLITGLTLTF